MKRYTTAIFLLATCLSGTALGYDDLPIYLDTDCPATKLPGSSASAAEGITLPMEGNLGLVPVTCSESLHGTNSIVLKAPSGSWWNYGIKPTEGSRSLVVRGYQDVRMWVKNKSGIETSFNVQWQKEDLSYTLGKTALVSASKDWQEIIVPLTDFSAGDSAIKAFYLRQSDDQPALDLLIDSITVTDGTSNSSLKIPKGIPGPLPASWPSTFLIGGLDKADVGKSTKEFQAGSSYRYQYVMKETQGYYSPSLPHSGEYVADYAKESEDLGVKSAFVWYNLGKSGEGFSVVSANLASSTYMEDYFTRYEWLLDQMIKGGQKDYMIILEPDMYGFLVRGPGDNGMAITREDPTAVAVSMTKANSLSGKTYAPNLKGWAEYMIARAKDRLKDQGVIVGHMPNHWGVNIPGQIGRGSLEAHLISGMTTARFLNGFGTAGKGDVVFVEKTDYDAGIKGAQWFWDSTCYAKFFTWTRAIAHGTGLPMVGWQMAQGNSTHATATKRDDIVETFLAHPQWWTDGGFIGILFGGGNPGCANYAGTDDAGWYQEHISAYNASPVSLTPNSTGLGNQTKPARDALRAHASHGHLFLSGWDGTARVELMDAAGKRIVSRSLRSGQGVSLQGLRGAVFVRVQQEGMRQTTSVLIP